MRTPLRTPRHWLRVASPSKSAAALAPRRLSIEVCTGSSHPFYVYKAAIESLDRVQSKPEDFLGGYLQVLRW
jgi:hypothetical protein